MLEEVIIVHEINLCECLVRYPAVRQEHVNMGITTCKDW